MNLVVKKLSVELIDDYIHFHKNVAFSDNPQWAGCYCVWYHWNQKLDIERKEYEEAGGTEFKLNLARRMITQNRLRGYLAYVDDQVIGWCNANNRDNYEKLGRSSRPDLWNDYVGEKVKSIICFTIAPHMRRKGLSGQILSEVIKDTKTENYDYIEVYPGTDKANGRSYHGSISIYEKHHFKREKQNLGVMRLYL